VETQARNPETIDTRLLLKVLMAFKKGDFSARLPVEKTGTVGKIGQRAALSGASGSWRINANSMEGRIEGPKSSGT
jgi:hypothetical protein